MAILFLEGALRATVEGEGKWKAFVRGITIWMTAIMDEEEHEASWGVTSWKYPGKEKEKIVTG